MSGARVDRPALCVSLTLALMVAVLGLLPAGSAWAVSAPVSVFPIPGSRVASPATQITFRGLPPGDLGRVVVSGSRSGSHAGRVVGDSDGQGGSFLPASDFTPGEIVTVRTVLNVVGAHGGVFQFTVATPAGAIPFGRRPSAPRVRGDVWSFRSRRDLAPAAVRIVKFPTRAAPGDIFLAPQFGPVQDGPMILGPSGGLIWFDQLPPNDWATDVKVQRYAGRPVLTWWQGYVNAGVGVGEGVIRDSAYRQVALVKAANGLSADLHEFEISPHDTALITAYYPVYADARSVHGSSRQIVLDSVVQEIDIPTGLVLFQWDSLDHVPFTDSYQPLPRRGTRNPFDYFHVNAIQQDVDGNIVISARNTWAAYKINHSTGTLIWALGGKHSSFKMGPGTTFAFQHDVRLRPANLVTVFDDGAGPPAVHSQSRGITLRLDYIHATATLVTQDEHQPRLLASYEGNVEPLANGDDFLGWGQQPYFSEFNSRGQLVFDGRFVDNNSNYRAYRFPWTATPTTSPAVATGPGRRGFTNVYASWNGATTVSSWRVLTAAKPESLRPMETVRKSGFETVTSFRGHEPYVAVQALDSRGRILATSHTTHSH